MRILGRGEKGVTLMELIVIITVIGLAIPALMTNFSDISMKAIRSEGMADATFHSGELLEEITAKAFVDPEQPGNTALGPNTGESYPGFDDVDDFHGFTRTAGGFNISVEVAYVSLSGASWAVSGSPTDFKRILVRTHNGRQMIDSEMAALAARR